LQGKLLYELVEQFVQAISLLRGIVMSLRKSSLLVVLSTFTMLGVWVQAQTLAARKVTIPSGTRISVRNDEAIDSQNASAGQTYSATVIQEVQGEAGEVLIPKESPAELVVRHVSSGSATGSSQLVLDLKSITVNGHRYHVSSEEVTQSGNAGLGKNRRTAEMVGGGAVLGTLIGAIAGGGKGAAIGAAAGGAAGGTAQVLTRGKQVKVPAETILNFQLDQPLRLLSTE
jgi:hypothetical protein